MVFQVPDHQYQRISINSIFYFWCMGVFFCVVLLFLSVGFFYFFSCLCSFFPVFHLFSGYLMIAVDRWHCFLSVLRWNRLKSKLLNMFFTLTRGMAVRSVCAVLKTFLITAKGLSPGALFFAIRLFLSLSRIFRG